MRDKQYFSVRTGKHPTNGRLDIKGMNRLFLSVYNQLCFDGFFQEAFGYDCIDAGRIYGFAGRDIESFFFRKLRKQGLWPIVERLDDYSEDDLFDVIELLHDCVSKGVEGRNHSWGDCGWHYDTFDKQSGQEKFRLMLNEILSDFGPGYRLTNNGEIVTLPPEGLDDLDEAPDPPGDQEAVQARIRNARDKFRRRGSTFFERRDAVRDLSDVLEYLRPQAKKVLHSKDEDDLFNLANNFGIRHHTKAQKTDYDPEIWLSWAYYYYLATIHAVTRLIERVEQTPSDQRQL